MEYRISELCDIRRGASPRPIKNFIVESHEDSFPWVKIADATKDSSRYISITKERVSKEGSLKSVEVVPGDLIISNSATPGLPKIMKTKAFIHDGWLLLRNFKNVRKEFLYYVLIQNREKLLQLSNGSVFNNLKTDIVKNFKVNIPSLKTQDVILRMITMIEDKLDLNEQIITNLEELSQTLFKRWFVDFEFPDENGNPYKSSGGEMIGSELGKIPFNWKCSKIKDINIVISDHVANGSFKSIKENVQFAEDLIDEYAVFARNVDLKKGNNKFEKYVTKTSYDFLKKTHLYGHEVIISNVGDVGSVYLSPILNKPMVLGNNQIFLNSDDKNMNYYFYLFFKSTIGKNLINSITSGSVQMKFNKTDLRNSFIILPNKNDMDNLIEIIKKHINLIENKKNENMKLTQLRDTLLPKLMSGELEIPDDIEVNKDEFSI
ncbi:restriction endonuclease subunit S [Staphylococcus arlettae]|uniref:restriction endonuclease subunit S n=1 Tax=Staphylococcus arlettae TaxID=29378 RepID=UPI000E688525|nr:restriction endonuclease subunit S [Staphylococcus arlettae]RIM60500.1 restriction endonuclease subunit S [Staphylococcus arlettae]